VTTRSGSDTSRTQPSISTFCAGIEAHPELLGIGIDENTAIVVQGDEFEVIGQSYVLIYDNQKMVGDRGHFYFIPPGGRFNLSTREATRGGRNPQPIGGPRPQPWPGKG
jgi:cyanophycinase